MKDKISGLIRLQDCDNRIRDVYAKKKEGPRKISELETEFNASKIRFQEEYNRLETLKKDRRKIEQEVQDIENKVEKSQIKLSNIKSNKEYTAVLKEMEDLDREKTLTEDKVLQLMEEIEELEKKCQENRDEEETLTRKFDLEKRAIEEELKELDNEMAFLEKQRREFCEEIDQDLLNRYLFLKERKGGLAIGSVIGGVCQSCHMGIPPQKFNELIKGHSLMTCPNCNRMVYWGEDEYIMKVLNRE